MASWWLMVLNGLGWGTGEQVGFSAGLLVATSEALKAGLLAKQTKKGNTCTCIYLIILISYYLII